MSSDESGIPSVTAPHPVRAAAPPAGRPGAPSPSAALIVSLLGFTVITIDVSAVTIALPAIRSSLHGGMTGLQWVVDAYTLMFAALMLSAGGARRPRGRPARLHRGRRAVHPRVPRLRPRARHRLADRRAHRPGRGRRPS
ncbi:hypothetical protein GCM10020221_26410 [Streptomyces thioluteus]|uniref:MFS transporter n=1 Tax=Streptomyces thioluteus TaxID=66431 RepID=A0ABN3WVD0_STRTU